MTETKNRSKQKLLKCLDQLTLTALALPFSATVFSN